MEDDEAPQPKKMEKKRSLRNSILVRQASLYSFMDFREYLATANATVVGGSPHVEDYIHEKIAKLK